MNTLQLILNIIVMLALMYGIMLLQKKHYSFTVRVLSALIVGILYGTALQCIYGSTSIVVKDSNAWFALIGTGYVSLLKMIVIPLIFVSISCSIINQNSKNLGKTAITIILVLSLTAGMAAAVGATTASVFGLNANGIQAGEMEKQASKNLDTKLTDFQAKSFQDQLLQIIPTNPFYSMTGQGSNATLSVVFFAAFSGVAIVGLKKKNTESGETFTRFLNSLHDVVMRMVTIILKLTPFGVLALMTRFVSTSNFESIVKLISFVIASYVAIFIMFIIHMFIIAGFKLNPFTYIRKVAPVLAFAFTSRTSAGTLPLTIEAQRDKLGVSEGIANLSSSLGTSIGQNGCAGIYPAMLAVMIAASMGIPMTAGFFAKLIIITAIGSFGIAGVGGGATFAALTVLSAMGLPVGLVGLLIAIEPLIDMARTALNVSDSFVSGLVTSKLMKEIDIEVYNNKQNQEVSL